MEVINWGFAPECEPLGCATDGLLPPHTGGGSGSCKGVGPPFDPICPFLKE